MIQDDINYPNALMQARKQARAERAFYTHLTAYVGVIALLVFINISTGDGLDGNWWVQWPAMGWGIGLAIHALTTFRRGAFLGSDWEEKKVAELMRRNQKN